MIFKGPLQPKPFYDSILYYFWQTFQLVSFTNHTWSRVKVHNKVLRSSLLPLFRFPEKKICKGLYFMNDSFCASPVLPSGQPVLPWKSVSTSSLWDLCTVSVGKSIVRSSPCVCSRSVSASRGSRCWLYRMLSLCQLHRSVQTRRDLVERTHFHQCFHVPTQAPETASCLAVG